MNTKLPKKTSYWWILLFEGVIQLILGLLLLFSTDITVFLLIQLLGIYWLLRGIIMIVQVFITKESNKGLLAAGGILGIISGIIVLRYPLFSGFILLEFLVIMIALVGMLQGTIALTRGFSNNNIWDILLGIVLWIVCIMIFFNPLSSVMALPVAIGLIWTISGIILTVAAFSLRK